MYLMDHGKTIKFRGLGSVNQRMETFIVVIGQTIKEMAMGRIFGMIKTNMSVNGRITNERARVRYFCFIYFKRTVYLGKWKCI